MDCIDDGRYNVDYERINRTLLDGTFMNTYLIVVEGNYNSIYDDDYICHSYYIIIFSSYPYTLQVDLSIDGQVISSGEMVC